MLSEQEMTPGCTMGRKASRRRWFRLLTWPPYSPDLTPIEHLLDVLNKQVRSMQVPPRNSQDLKGSAATVLLPDTTAHHQRSMPRQVKAILVGGENHVAVTYSLPHHLQMLANVEQKSRVSKMRAFHRFSRWLSLNSEGLSSPEWSTVEAICTTTSLP